jgi:hypothetical protein
VMWRVHVRSRRSTSASVSCTRRSGRSGAGGPPPALCRAPLR